MSIKHASHLMMLFLSIFTLSCSEGDIADEFVDDYYGKCNELTMTYDRGSEHWVRTIRVSQDPSKGSMPSVKENNYGTGFNFRFIPVYSRYSDEAYGSTEGSYTSGMGYYEISICKFGADNRNAPLAKLLPKGTSVNDDNDFDTEFAGKAINTLDYEYDSGTIYVKELTKDKITLELRKVKYVDYDNEPYTFLTINGTMSFERKDKYANTEP